MWDLKSGDAAIKGSHDYADYREQLISQAEVSAMAASFQEQAGILTDPREFVTGRKRWLTAIAEGTDLSFPENDALCIENGEPVLTKLTRKNTPPRLTWLEATIRAEMEETPILDALVERPADLAGLFLAGCASSSVLLIGTASYLPRAPDSEVVEFTTRARSSSLTKSS
jgi:hypothetical protein